MKVAFLFVWNAVTSIQAQLLDNLPPPKYDEAIDRGESGFYPTRSLKTFNDNVKIPFVNFLQWNPQCDDGLYYFITPRGYSVKDKAGPVILDSRGELIWAEHYDNFAGGQAYNFLVQPYRGKDHLTFWVGEDRVKGHGAGFCYFLNSSYDVVALFGGARGLWADLHEFTTTNDNTALMSVYDVVQSDFSTVREDRENHDPGYVWDSVVQEIDLRTHKLKWQWRATEHIDTNETYRSISHDGTEKDPYDWFHINSAQKDELGNYLLSARFLHSILYVDGRTKKTIWQLGGKHNSFMDLSGGNATNFAWQHDARFHPTDTFPRTYTAPSKRPGFTTKLLTFLDNASENQHYHYGLPLSRGLLLEVMYPTPGTGRALAGPRRTDYDRNVLGRNEGSEQSELDAEKMSAMNGSDPNYTVRVIMSYANPDGLRSSSQGNMQLIPQAPGEDPKVLVGYGLDAAWTEFASNGTVLCDVHYGAKTSFETGEIQSYRVFKFPWKGKPRWKPKAIADGKLYMSWIGATDVAEWVIQASLTKSEEESAWKEVLRIRKTQFEESVEIPDDVGSARYLQVIALDKNGAPLENGVSDAVDRGILAVYFSLIDDHIARHGTYFVLLEICIIMAFPALLYEVYRRCLR